MKNKGVPHVRNKNHRGDQLVIVHVAIPTKLNKEQRQLFEKLAETLGTTVKPQEKGFLDWLNETFGGYLSVNSNQKSEESRQLTILLFGIIVMNT